jgi:hypothetical protein
LIQGNERQRRKDCGEKEREISLVIHTRGFKLELVSLCEGKRDRSRGGDVE